MKYETWLELHYPHYAAERTAARAARRRLFAPDREIEHFSEYWAEETRRVNRMCSADAIAMRRISFGMSEAGKRAALEAPLRARIAKLEGALEARENG